MWLRLLPAFGALLALQSNQVQIPPAPRGFGTQTSEVVVDAANVLSPTAVDRVNQIAHDVHLKSGGEMAMLTLSDIGQRDPIDIGVQTGRAWGIGSNADVGQAKRNAGVLILLVPKETNSSGRGSCRIVVARGAEGFITDAMSGDMCREAVPLLQQRNYSDAAVLLAQRVAARYASEFGFSVDSTLQPAPVAPVEFQQQRRSGFRVSPQLIFLLLIFALSILSSRGRGRRGGCGGCLPIFLPFGGGGFGGGSSGGWGGGGGGGFGGGSFGGFGGGGGFSGGGGGSDW